MIRRVIQPLPSLRAALIAAQVAFETSGVVEETWLLPSGTHPLSGALELGAPGRRLTLRGDRTTIRLGLDAGVGGLRLVGAVIRVDALRVQAGVPVALDIEADEAEVTGVDVEPDGPDAPRLGVRIVARVAARAIDVTAAGLRGAAPHGLMIRAPQAYLLNLRVRDVVETAPANPADPSLIDAPDAPRGAAGVLVDVDGDRLEAARIEVEDVTGSAAIGARLLAGRLAGLDTEATLSVVDLRAERLTATDGPVIGALLGSQGACALRGFTAQVLRGPQAGGILIGSGPLLDVGVGQIQDVIATAGIAFGVRALGASRGAAAIRDVFVGRVAGGVPPLVEPRPADDWRSWQRGALQIALQTGAPFTVPPLPAALDCVGIHLDVEADVCDPASAPDPIRLEDSAVRMVAGTALQIVGGTRAAGVRRLELHRAHRAGYVQGEDVQLAEATIDRVGGGIAVGPGEIAVINSLLTRHVGPAWRLDPDAILVETLASFATAPEAPFSLLGALPYRVPGPGGQPPEFAIGALPLGEIPADLRLVESFATAPAVVPGDTEPSFIGAHPPEAPPRCRLDDPDAPPYGAVAHDAPPPVADYLARDAQSLLALMLDRARQTMPGWTERGAADMTSMVFEALANRLDHLAYAQERAVEEGYLETARQRRSVEAHARALDYRPDPGLSATTMLAFDVDDAALDGLRTRVSRWVEARGIEVPDTPDPTRHPFDAALADGLHIPAGTLVSNAGVDDAIIFGTEADLVVRAELRRLSLAETVPVGAHTALLDGALPSLERGQWLLFDTPAHVIRITRIERAPDVTRIWWDPRRPAPAHYPGPAEVTTPATLSGNLVPAHHGVPVGPGHTSGPFARFAARLRFEVRGAPSLELRLPPLAGLAWHTPGHPLPGDAERRQGAPRITVRVEGEPWRRVDSLALHGPEDEVFTVEQTDVAVVRFPDGISGALLPERDVVIEVDVVLGAGPQGNVGVDALERLIQLGGGNDALRVQLGGPSGPDFEDFLEQLITVRNPIPAVGGRDAEALASIRYRAPFGASDARTAVTLVDYERLIEELPEVAGARAVLRPHGIRSVVHLTVLLADADQLDDAERLRRWSVVRRQLETIRLLGFDVQIEPPRWVALDLDLLVDVDPHADAGALRAAIHDAIGGEGGLLDPDRAGLGGDVHLDALYRAVLGVTGVRAVDVRRFRRCEPDAPERLREGLIPIGPSEVAVLRPPRTDAEPAALTVTVRGGLR